MKPAHAFSALLMLSLCACSMEPHYTRPPAPMPASWSGRADPPSEASVATLGYRDVLKDHRLVMLVEKALVNNRDLRLAAANIALQRANLDVQRARQLPEIDGGATAGFSRKGYGATSGAGVFSADVGVSAFEIDLFGRLASLTHAQQAVLLASQATARAVRLALISDIADSWLSYARDRKLLDIANATVITAQRIRDLTQMRFASGIAPRTDVLQSEDVLQTAKADMADQNTALEQDINALRLLVGDEIDPALLPAAIETVNEAIVPVPAGIQSGVLLARPDVVAAEQELRAANAEIGAARAALFPRLTLTGALGFASAGLATLLSHGGLAHSVAGDVTYPIFNAGGARAQVAASKARRDAALATYDHTIQTAFREVADALARRATIDSKLQAVTRQEQALAGAYRLAEMRYRGAVEPFLTTLDAQRSLYGAQRTLTETQFAVLHNRVVVYHVLGGDALGAVTG